MDSKVQITRTTNNNTIGFKNTYQPSKENLNWNHK